MVANCFIETGKAYEQGWGEEQEVLASQAGGEEIKGESKRVNPGS
jgi:hypothetical protein